MTDANRDAQDVAWLEARERGAPVLPQIDPQRAAAYDEIQALIAGLPDESAPNGWEHDVLAALPPPGRAELSTSVAQLTGTAARKNPTAASKLHSGRGRWIALGTTLAALAAVVLWRQLPGAPDVDTVADGTPLTRVVHRAGSRAGLGNDATVGDTLHVEVNEPGPGELRVYRDDQEVVMRCPGPPPCVRSARRLEGELRLAAPGQYRAVYLMPAPTGRLTSTLANDLANCGCSSRVAVPVVAR